MSSNTARNDENKSSSESGSSSSYKEPSALLKRLFLPPKTPSLALSSDKQWLLFSGEPSAPSIEVLAKPVEKLAGLRFDPTTLTPSRLCDYAFDLQIQHLLTKKKQLIPLPQNSEGIRYIRFNPNPTALLGIEQQFVFISKVKNSDEFQLYVCELFEGEMEWQMPHRIYSTITSNKRANFINGCAYQFTSDGKYLLAKVVPSDRSSGPPEKDPASVGPSIQSVQLGARKAPGRTYQDLLKNRHDEEKLKYYLKTELYQIDLTKPTTLDAAKLVPQSKDGVLIQSMESSPSGRYLLVEIITKFSYSVPLKRFGKEVQIWDLSRDDDLVITVASNPVDDEIPLSYDACSRHKRRFEFHPCHPHTIIYAQALDGGDNKNDPSPEGERDALYLQEIIENEFKLKPATKWIGLEWRYDDIAFTESGIALVDEYRWKDRMERKWRIGGNKDDDKEKKMVWERSWEDRYKSPGIPLTQLGPNGQYFVVTDGNNGTKMFLKGSGASPLGDRPFLDSMDLLTLKKERLWRCKAPLEGELNDPSLEVGGVLPNAKDRKDVYESFVTMIPSSDELLLLISRESKTTPRNYYITTLSSSDPPKDIQVTNFPHPQPDLLGIEKELVKYKREDGIELTANLYYSKEAKVSSSTEKRNDGGGTDSNSALTPRPTLFWAYPREFKDSKAAGQVKGSKHKFVSASWASPIHWAAKGWAVMDDFSLPVIGEGEKQPNDTFVEQIVAGATAAVKYATERGVCDPTKCAVGGHSYGSFMTAHLLSHTSLFAAGIGRSGAYNRTLTPMSFQSEDRSLWEAPDTYITMSPIMHVQKYSNQERVGKLLLIHGGEDENSGTHPMQSERFFGALKAFGIESRLCVLPYERHSYRAKESILHMAWEQEEWLRTLE